ncbi:hypothetical protein [Spirosoma endbachense]|uniref:Uncharacterized protein n=1 Tax=Spirosoma endbachense TaxID=2666025 RepID=A0A6P1VZ46_9BACT|nr:hypothetical protein [Spirosoma endbachense]QHV97894.1 hypothetical protein GJR95_24080 [Spirosoma endbachense]
MIENSPSAKVQLLDFTGYHRYLMAGAGQLIAKDLPLTANYQVLQTDCILLRFSGTQMMPTIPADTIVEGEVVNLHSLDTLPTGLYVALLEQEGHQRIDGFIYGRLKEKPGLDSLTLWPENPRFAKQLVPLRHLAFLFRIRAYRLSKTVLKATCESSASTL